MVGKYTEAAHEAYRAVEETGQLFECVHAGNALVYAFLLEVRKVLLASGGGGGYGGGHQERFPMSLKKAALGVKTWPLRIYDAASAQETKGVGAQIATIIVKHLFKAYPPEPPSEEELEEQRVQKAAAKQLEAQARKRKAGQGGGSGKAGAGSAAVVAAAARGPQGHGVGRSAGAATAGEDEGPQEAGSGQKRRKTAKAKAPKEYIPKIGSANYAFLIVLLEAHKGPSKADFLTKAELMQRAEASGLADKPISGEGNPAHGQANPQNYYNGWSCFNSQLVNAHALAMTYSNPKKCALTPKGLDLAERLYRHAVDSNRLAPIPGIPSTGPFLFQLARDPAEAPDQQGHSRWEAPGSAGRPAAGAGARAAPAAAVPLRQNRPTAAYQRGGSTAAAGAVARGGDMLNLPGYGTGAHGGGATEYTAAAQAPSYQYAGPGIPYGVPTRAGPQTGAAAIAAALAAAGLPVRLAEPPSFPKMVTAEAPAGVPRDAAQVPVAGARATHAAAAARPVRLSQPTTSSQVEVVDLLDDEDDLPPLAARLAAASGMAPAGPRLQGAPAGSGGATAGGNRASAGAVDCTRDGDVALLIDMGYSRKHAVKAMRRASNVSEAVDMLDTLSSSDSESDSESGSPAFHDASETLPDEDPFGPDPVGHNPTVPDHGRKHMSGQAAGVAQSSHDELRSQRLRWLEGQQQPQQRQQPQREQSSHPRAATAAPPVGLQPAATPARPPAAATTAAAAAAALAAAGPARGHMRLGSQQGGAGAGRYYMGSQQSTDLDDVDLDSFGSQGGLAAGPAGPLSRAGSGVALGPGGVPRPLAPVASGFARAGSGAVTAAAATGAVQLSQQGAVGSIRQQAGDLRLPPIPAGRTFAQEYEVVFLVDGREQYSRYNVQGRHTSLDDHITQMQRAGLRVERRQLEIGDATWIARSTSRSRPVREYVLDFVVERKSVEDLASSIKNGDRYKRQKFWLRKCGLRHVYYLVEGDPDHLPPTEQKGVKTAAASIEVLDQFCVLRTKGHHETFRMYQALSRKIEAMYGPAQGGSPAVPSAAAAGDGQLMTFGQWDAHMTRITTGNTTLHDVWALMLAAVPGVGPEGAMAVLQHYPTPLSLYNKYCQVLREAAARQQDGRAAAHAVLLGLRRDGYGCRPLGPEKARRVFDALFARGGWSLAPR